MSDTQKDPAEPFDSATGTNPTPTTDSSRDAFHAGPEKTPEEKKADEEVAQKAAEDKGEYLKEQGIGQSGESLEGETSE